ncbi:S1/P1 nuclease [Bacteriovorax stolpii]|uniref:S1/P1 nuclease n=1 Tax=Bacteriovorax stolpii TaxID=960 RepID=UPI00163C7CCA|nr:S1/P1 nuclease [Bacteriovorax stolpii]
MTFKKVLLVCAVLSISPKAFSWGKTGHRIVAEIAQRNLNTDAQKGVKDLLGVEDLSRVATYSDEIRSNKAFDYTAPWHYASIPTGKTYFDQKRSKDGDVIEGLFRMEETLRDPKKSKEDKAFALKFMVHMMGDLHQPLHVGIAEDRGGNTVRLRWFKGETNLHAIWDESIVDFEQLSYTEYSTYLNHFTSDEKKDYSKGTFLDWAKESQDLRGLVYDTGGSENLTYEYHFRMKPTMELRLRQAGIRLASLLNSIFKNEKLPKEYEALRQKVKDNI